MDGSTIWFDRGLFSDEVVARAAHRYTGACHVAIQQVADRLGVVLTAHDGTALPGGLEARFRDDVLDERLRDSVRRETQGLHAELIRAALREALPQREEEAP